jgi:glycosyltransferase involved in cell wall biosynthesis
MTDNTKVLVLMPGPVSPPTDQAYDRFFYLGQFLSGDILQPVWDFKDEAGKQRTVYKLPSFTYHFTKSYGLPSIVKFFWDIYFFIFKGFSLFLSGEQYAVVICYGLTRTGLAALVLKVLTGAKLIVEVPGIIQDQFILDEKSPGVVAKFKNLVTSFWAKILFRFADRVKILYPEQLGTLRPICDAKISSFPDFVAVSKLAKSEKDLNYLMFLGFPWYLKGVDLLLTAFGNLYQKFPGMSLKIVGYCPNREPFIKLIPQGCPVELIAGVPYQEALKLISDCSVLVLPSRTESMGRVLIEAMAMGKPVIGSSAGGIPAVIEDLKTGLIFESGNASELEKALLKMLENKPLREQLANNGYLTAHQKHSEEQYAKAYQEMIEEIIKN